MFVVFEGDTVRVLKHKTFREFSVRQKRGFRLGKVKFQVGGEFKDYESLVVDDGVERGWFKGLLKRWFAPVVLDPEVFPIVVFSDSSISPLSIAGEEWFKVRDRLRKGKKILVFRDVEGLFYPVVIKKEVPDKVGFASEMFDSDKARGFKAEVVKTKQLSTSKWSRVVKLVITILLIILALGGGVIAIVLVSKASSDQLSTLAQIGNNVSSGGFLNYTTGVLGG